MLRNQSFRDELARYGYFSEADKDAIRIVNTDYAWAPIRMRLLALPLLQASNHAALQHDARNILQQCIDRQKQGVAFDFR